MTTLATRPVEEPDLLSLLADGWTARRKPFADAFREACQAEAEQHDGLVDPSEVRLRLLEHPQYNPRQLSALWSTACGRDGYLDIHRDRLVPIRGEGSRGNSNKQVPMRSWRGWKLSGGEVES